MKKVFILLSAVMICISSAVVSANDDIRVYKDGQGLSFDVPPQIIEDYTFVPMRAVFEAFDMTVVWDGDTKTVTAQGNGNTVTMTVGDNRIFKNGTETQLDISARIVGDRTLVPVRAVSESLECEVKWDDDERKVNIISSPDKIIGTATIENMRCLIDYQPIDFVNIDGFTYLKATDLDKYGFDVTEQNGDVYVKRNKDKLPLLIDEYKNDLIGDKWFKPAEYPDTNHCHNIQSIWTSPKIGKTFDIFISENKVYLDNIDTNAHNINGEMYMQADELQKYGSVKWVATDGRWDNPWRGFFPNTLIIEVANSDLDTIYVPWGLKLEQEDYSGYVSCEYGHRYCADYGLFRYKNGKKNGIGYYMSYYQEIPRSIIYEAGEYEDDKLKNGIRITNDLGEGITLFMYEVKDFEKTRLYPKE